MDLGPPIPSLERFEKEVARFEYLKQARHMDRTYDSVASHRSYFRISRFGSHSWHFFGTFIVFPFLSQELSLKKTPTDIHWLRIDAQPVKANSKVWPNLSRFIRSFQISWKTWQFGARWRWWTAPADGKRSLPASSDVLSRTVHKVDVSSTLESVFELKFLQKSFNFIFQVFLHSQLELFAGQDHVRPRLHWIC